MKVESIVGAVVGIGGVLLVTGLLIGGKISELTFATGVAASAIAALALHGFSRLESINFKELTVAFRELKAATDEAKQLTQRLESMYGGIENLRREPMVLDDTKMAELGTDNNGLPLTSAVMRYPAGCIKRERERLARIFVNQKSPEQIAQAILDNSMDDKVFKWNGPESPLDATPISVAERKRRKMEKEDTAKFE